MSQEQIRTQHSQDAPGPDAPTPAPAPAQDFATVLADIDEILEVNALQFVQGFVQEGGQ